MLKQIYKCFNSLSTYTPKVPRAEGLPEQVYSIFTEKYDAIVIGGGVSGLFAAINLSQQGYSTAIVTKSYPTRSNSVTVTEGINAVYSEKDDWNNYNKATLHSSQGLSSPSLTQQLCQDSSSLINTLVTFGMPFDRDSSGNIQTSPNPENPLISWSKAGHLTGHNLLQTLTGQALKQKVRILPDFFALDLILQGNQCQGLVALNILSGNIHIFHSNSTVIATGGFARIFNSTTQSSQNTGDGNALVSRAGFPNQNLEFVKYKPLSLYNTGHLIETSILTGKAKLLNRSHEEFLLNAEENKICLAMAQEIRGGRGAGPKQDHLFLDVSSVDRAEVEEKLPFLKYFKYSSLLPVQPTAYKTLGGIPTDSNTQVISNEEGNVIENLYAIGEVASSPVHGSNLLVGNSLTEALFSGKLVANTISTKTKPSAPFQDLPNFIQDSTIIRLESWRVKKGTRKIVGLKKKLQNTISSFCGLIKNKENLDEGLRKLVEFSVLMQEVHISDRGLKHNLELIEAIEIENMLTVAKQMIAAVNLREESRGCHNREDFEKPSEKWLKHTLTWLQSPDGEVGLETRSII